MSQPATTQVHVNRPLTNILISYFNRPEVLAGMQVFGRVPVPKMTDSYFLWTKDDLLRLHAKKRAPGAPAARSGVPLTTDTYTCLREALAVPIDDPTAANQDAPLNLDRDMTEFIGRQINMAIEVDFSSSVFAASTWTGSSTGADLTANPVWSNSASTPIEDVATECMAILENNAIMPNVMVLGYQTFKDLKNHPDILDRIKYGGGPGNPAMVTPQALAQLFGVERIVVAGATRNTAAEGATASYDFIQSQARAWLGYANPTPSINQPSAGYTFVWNDGDRSGGVEGVKRWRDEEVESWIIEGGLWFDHKVVAASLGAFWTTATS